MEFPKNIDLASLFFPNANLATRKKHVSSILFFIAKFIGSSKFITL